MPDTQDKTLTRYVLRRFPKEIALCVGLLLVSSLLDALSVIILAPIVDLVLQASGATAAASGVLGPKVTAVLSHIGIPNNIWAIVAFFMAINLLRNGVMIVTWNRVVHTQFRVQETIMHETFDTVINASWTFFTSHKQGVFINAFAREIPRVSAAFMVIAQLASNTIQILIFLALPLWISWRTTAACALFAGVALIPFLWVSRLNHRWGRQATNSAGQFTSIVQESFSLAKVMHAFGNQKYAARALVEAFREYRVANTRSQTLSRAVPLLYHPAGLVALMLAYVVARKTGLPLAEFAVILYALWKALPVLSNVTALRGGLMEYTPAYEKVASLLTSARSGPVHSGTRPFTGLSRAISLEKVSFIYPGTDKRVLQNIDLHIPKGSFCALVGPSGAGKTTVVDLILGFYPASGGQICIDGVPLPDLVIGDYRNRIAYVPQESVLFDTTVRANLLWARPDATEADLHEALRLANAHEFIAALPEGLETVVGDRGYRLSGGQVQRLSLARALLRKPDILLLDEATSALDTESERLIQQSIESLGGHLTVIAIAHRLSTIARADRIFVLEDGRLVESGSYAELAEGRGSRFREMLARQGLVAA